MEMFDLVDENDIVIGSASRDEVRTNNLLHRGVCIFVFNSDGELFVHKRTDSKDIYPGFWDMCIGGGLDSGESYESAAKREVNEELGFDPDLKFLFKLRYKDDVGNVWFSIFKCTHDGPIALQKDEIAHGEFMSIEKLNDLLKKEKFCPDAYIIWDKYTKLNNPC